MTDLIIFICMVVVPVVGLIGLCFFDRWCSYKEKIKEIEDECM